MANNKYILVSHYCENANIENSFVHTLHEFGLVTFEIKENSHFIDEEDIDEIERMFRLHHDLGINFEGLDALSQMMSRMSKLERELMQLKQKLHLYE